MKEKLRAGKIGHLTRGQMNHEQHINSDNKSTTGEYSAKNFLHLLPSSSEDADELISLTNSIKKWILTQKIEIFYLKSWCQPKN